MAARRAGDTMRALYRAQAPLEGGIGAWRRSRRGQRRSPDRGCGRRGHQVALRRRLGQRRGEPSRRRPVRASVCDLKAPARPFARWRRDVGTDTMTSSEGGEREQQASRRPVVGSDPLTRRAGLLPSARSPPSAPAGRATALRGAPGLASCRGEKPAQRCRRVHPIRDACSHSHCWPTGDGAVRLAAAARRSGAAAASMRDGLLSSIFVAHIPCSVKPLSVASMEKAPRARECVGRMPAGHVGPARSRAGDLRRRRR